MGTIDRVEQGRRAFGSRAWGEAYAALRAAGERADLGPDDLERLGLAAYLTGRDGEAHDNLDRCYQRFLAAGESARAARAAFWLGMLLVNRGEVAQGSGWLGRAARAVEGQPGCVEEGYLLLPPALQAVDSGDTEAASRLFGQATEIARRGGDPDLLALGRLGLGQTLVTRGETAAGLSLLDEVMVSVQAGEVSALSAGIVYCAVIEICQSVYDLRRAREWTAALSDWCAGQPDLVPYRGQCLVHRAEILQRTGAWPEAVQEARRACERLSTPANQPAVGAARYRLAELHRLRGELGEAEDGYREASRHGHSPQPGLARLRLAQGKQGAARAGLRRALEEESRPGARAGLLAASVEVELEAGDAAAARGAADELAALAAKLDVAPLRAMAAQASGAVLLAESDPRGALSPLRSAWSIWRELEAPYEAALARVLIGLACRELGDGDGAELELAAARDVFRGLGAGSHLTELDDLLAPPGERTAGGLTGREVEVLRLVANGSSNREVAAALVISEHTVARHVQNILAKLGVPSRTAAAAFAYEHGLV